MRTADLTDGPFRNIKDFAFSTNKGPWYFDLNERKTNLLTRRMVDVHYII